MMSSPRWLVIALAAAFLMVGCGASGGNGTVPNTGSVSSSDSKQLDIKAAGARYEELVAPANCSGAAFIEAAAGLEATTLIKDAKAALQPLAAEAADAYEAFGSAMDAESWPDEAQSAAQTVASRAHEEADTYRAVADAEDNETFRMALTTLQEAEQAPRPSGRLRAALGLDANQHIQDVDC